MKQLKGSYFISQDHDCHWYLIPVKYKAEWEEFLNIPSEDERSWDVPAFAVAIDGPHKLTFVDPEYD